MVMSCPILGTLIPPPVYPIHKINHKLISNLDKFPVKHTRHCRGLVQTLTRYRVLHDNSLQPTKLVHHTDRQVSLHYVIANERKHDRP
jgi:hypothetical protein